jgi:RNA polymerase sigma-70 factor (ECF subfamily)
MNEVDLASRFDALRPRMRGVAYRILGSLGEADDAMQEAWIRLRRADAAEIRNLEAWLTTTVARICLNLLRARHSRREQPFDAFLPEPIIGDATGTDPEQEALLADAVGMALQVVLETLAPAERIAFVMHDMFAVPFDEIGAMLDRSPEASRQLASRGRRRVRDAAPPSPDAGLAEQRAAVDAYFAAARDGDLNALVAVLDPDVVLRAHGRGGVAAELHGSGDVAGGALMAQRYAASVRPALVNGAAAGVAFDGERPFAVLAFTVVAGRILAIDVFNDAQLVPRLEIPV